MKECLRREGRIAIEEALSNNLVESSSPVCSF